MLRLNTSPIPVAARPASADPMDKLQHGLDRLLREGTRHEIFSHRRELADAADIGDLGIPYRESRHVVRLAMLQAVIDHECDLPRPGSPDVLVPLRPDERIIYADSYRDTRDQLDAGNIAKLDLIDPEVEYRDYAKHHDTSWQ